MEDGGWRGRWRRREHVQKSKESCIMCSRRELMNKMLQISSLDQQPEANHWIGNVTTTLTSLLSSSLTFNKPESPRTTPADSVLVLPERHHEVHIWKLLNTFFSAAIIRSQASFYKSLVNTTACEFRWIHISCRCSYRLYKITLSFSRYTTTIMTTVKDTNTLHTLIININKLGTQSAKRQWIDETSRMSRIHQRQKSWIYKANRRKTERWEENRMKHDN